MTDRHEAARRWLRALAELPPQTKQQLHERRHAAELLTALELNRKPAPTAIEWLRLKQRQGDRLHRDWCSAILDQVQIILGDLHREEHTT